MRLDKRDVSIFTIIIGIFLIFTVMNITGCATWRGMGEDTKNITKNITGR